MVTNLSSKSARNITSVATLAFGELKPHSASFKEGRLDLVLVYYQFRYRPPTLPFPPYSSLQTCITSYSTASPSVHQNWINGNVLALSLGDHVWGLCHFAIRDKGRRPPNIGVLQSGTTYSSSTDRL